MYWYNAESCSLGCEVPAFEMETQAQVVQYGNLMGGSVINIKLQLPKGGVNIVTL